MEPQMDRNGSTMDASLAAPSFPAWITAAMVLGVFAIGPEALVVSPLLKDLSATFGIGDDPGGLAIAASGLTLGVSTPLIGAITDFFSRRPFIFLRLRLFAA